ncbi:unnamed protein product [Mycena citricolor]|uniref:Uncharacterized protein n=1 Tax=Mycena citricolor TaxID=2018698 RepID=A0AAD2JV86_9AGAR|nr:unnamed protein product [Mycena citricolor]
MQSTPNYNNNAQAQQQQQSGIKTQARFDNSGTAQDLQGAGKHAPQADNLDRNQGAPYTQTQAARFDNSTGDMQGSQRFQDRFGGSTTGTGTGDVSRNDHGNNFSTSGTGVGQAQQNRFDGSSSGFTGAESRRPDHNDFNDNSGAGRSDGSAGVIGPAGTGDLRQHDNSGAGGGLGFTSGAQSGMAAHPTAMHFGPGPVDITRNRETANARALDGQQQQQQTGTGAGLQHHHHLHQHEGAVDLSHSDAGQMTGQRYDPSGAGQTGLGSEHRHEHGSGRDFEGRDEGRLDQHRNQHHGAGDAVAAVTGVAGLEEVKHKHNMRRDVEHNNNNNDNSGFDQTQSTRTHPTGTDASRMQVGQGDGAPFTDRSGAGSNDHRTTATGAVKPTHHDIHGDRPEADHSSSAGREDRHHHLGAGAATGAGAAGVGAGAAALAGHGTDTTRSGAGTGTGFGSGTGAGAGRDDHHHVPGAFGAGHTGDATSTHDHSTAPGVGSTGTHDRTTGTGMGSTNNAGTGTTTGATGYDAGTGLTGSATNTTKSGTSLGDKIIGVAEKIAGKLASNPSLQERGQERKGELDPSTGRYH